ncbi:hypothetical protein N656DRAFT_410426 [Canariomyces notabilis]|uniref:Secreted protein n=1 Tax=Canariomyces notabilis TaxID=2074819 RepID=A0AAN6TK45_9PEZI|nr:hypothetical protein N656DRAFT_410426 [Canariomyces arenarius]
MWFGLWAGLDWTGLDAWGAPIRPQAATRCALCSLLARSLAVYRSTVVMSAEPRYYRTSRYSVDNLKLPLIPYLLRCNGRRKQTRVCRVIWDSAKLHWT